MSDNASAPTRDPIGDTDEYDEMVGVLDVGIDEALRKVENGRVYDAENEKVRIKWVRALAYAVNVRRQCTNDRTLEELGERMDRLEETYGVDQ